MPVTLKQFKKLLLDSELLSQEQIDSVESALPAEKRLPEDAQPFAREFVSRKLLTAHQATVIYQGKPKSLLYGNYLVIDKLGQGGMGMVFKAEHRRMKRLVALKVMSPAAMKSPDAVKRFHREVQAAAKLTHPNIVAAYDADQAQGIHFLVMEYVEGTDLANLVKKKGPLSAGKAIDYISQAARGLEHAHSQGIVHRDIKPANLLLDKQGTVKILDMGLARIDESVSGGAGTAAGLTQTGAIMGTVDYMSPEQALNTKYADCRADIYSLGCSLHFLLTGQPAYAGETLMEKLLAHREAPCPTLTLAGTAANPALNAVFAKMIAKKPEDRYQTTAELLADLQKLQSGASASVADAGDFPGSEDFAVRDFLAAISPAASGTSVRTRAEMAAADTLVGHSASNTQTSLLQSAVDRVARTPKPLKVTALAGIALLFVGLLLIAFLPGKKPQEAAVKKLIDDVKPSKPARQEPGSIARKANAAPEQSARQSPRLFEKSLAGWSALAPYWTVADGTLTGSTIGQRIGHNTFVCSPRSYRDFELSFQAWLKGDRGNSGVQIRSALRDPAKQTVAGPQVDIGGAYWGGLYGELAPEIKMETAPDNVRDSIRRDDFNDFFVRCTGRHLLVRVNGLVSIDKDFPALADEGIIAWQLHGGEPMEVVFRDIHLTELNDAAGTTPASPAKQPTWTSLFNGRNLAGWAPQGGGAWNVQDGVLKAQTEQIGWLMSDAEYGDFELELEYKLLAGGSSGIFLKAWPEGPVDGGQFFEVQLLDDDAPDYQNVPPHGRTAAIYGTVGPNPAPKTPAGQWHSMQIRLKDRKVQIQVNRQQVLNARLDDYQDKVSRFPGLGRQSAHIGLQNSKAGIEFRNIRIRELNSN